MTIVLAIAAWLALPGSAAAGGISGGAPVAKGVPGTIGADTAGLTAPGVSERIIQLPSDRGTVIARVEQDGGDLIRSASFREGLNIPAVAYDGSPGGLSADGKTLVLLPSQASPRSTTLAVLDAERLRVEKRVSLRGAFSFDAISPDGSRIYLIEYLSRADPTRYAVRELDLRSERLLPAPILDPDEPPGEMRGTASTRATSPDGRWAYTLYDGAEYPFIHALDTVKGRAVCIDLDMLAVNRGAYRHDLAPNSDGSALNVVDRKGATVAVV
ncbi:MAG: YncE family protein, partial [Microbacterium sp.]|uniref:YncE family protein n=1 Tax=Microbacterium sp. TaxID=51671 RepID=UPI003D700FD5